MLLLLRVLLVLLRVILIRLMLFRLLPVMLLLLLLLMFIKGVDAVTTDFDGVVDVVVVCNAALVGFAAADDDDVVAICT